MSYNTSTSTNNQLNIIYLKNNNDTTDMKVFSLTSRSKTLLTLHYLLNQKALPNHSNTKTSLFKLTTILLSKFDTTLSNTQIIPHTNKNNHINTNVDKNYNILNIDNCIIPLQTMDHNNMKSHKTNQ